MKSLSKDEQGLTALIWILALIVVGGFALGLRDSIPSVIEQIIASPPLMVGIAVFLLIALWIIFPADEVRR